MGQAPWRDLIDTVGSPEKVDLAHRNGCDYVIDDLKEDFAARVKEIAKGEGCHRLRRGR
jgi:NADPH2:quinone reductase